VKPDCRPKHKGRRGRQPKRFQAVQARRVNALQLTWQVAPVDTRATLKRSCDRAAIRRAGAPQYSGGQEDLQRWATIDNQKVGCFLRRTVTPMTVVHHLVYGIISAALEKSHAPVQVLGGTSQKARLVAPSVASN